MTHKNRQHKTNKGIEHKEPYDGSTPLKRVMQELFVENLLRGMFEGAAYTAAGYKSKSPSAHAIQLAKNSNVAARLAYRRGELQTQLQRETGISRKQVVDEFRKLAFSNMQDFITTDADGNIVFRNLESLTRDQMAAVESVKITKTTTTNRDGSREYTTQHTQFKLHPKTANLEDLGRHLGIFEADNEQQRPIQFNMLRFTINNADANTDHQCQLPGREVLPGPALPEVAG